MREYMHCTSAANVSSIQRVGLRVDFSECKNPPAIWLVHPSRLDWACDYASRRHGVGVGEIAVFRVSVSLDFHLRGFVLRVGRWVRCTADILPEWLELVN